MFAAVSTKPCAARQIGQSLVALLLIVGLALAPATARAGGPKYIAGATFFNPGVLGQPVHWSGGQVNGSSLQAHFAGGTPPVLSSLTPQLSLAAGATFTWTVQALVLSNGVPAAGQSVAWQSSASGIVSVDPAAVLTNASGIATRTLTVGPLAEGQIATINACLNGTSQCVAYTAFGARPEYALLQPIAGTNQSLAPSTVPAPIALRLLDMDGNPMAGGTVALYQALYAWTPPCAPHTVCAQGALLATESNTAVSAADGSVTFSPATHPGVATNLVGAAVSGNTGTVSIAIEQRP